MLTQIDDSLYDLHVWYNVRSQLVECYLSNQLPQLKAPVTKAVIYHTCIRGYPRDIGSEGYQSIFQPSILSLSYTTKVFSKRLVVETSWVGWRLARGEDGWGWPT